MGNKCYYVASKLKAGHKKPSPEGFFLGEMLVILISGDLPDYDKKFDVIIISHVLEHLINCRLVISSLRELLAEDGIIFIEVPNCEDLITLEHSVFTQPHLHHFTEKSLEFLFKSCGYEIIKSDIFFSHVVTLAEHIKYMLKWFLKIDCYTKGTNSHGNILRLIVSKTRKH